MTKVYRLETKVGTLEEGTNGAYRGERIKESRMPLADMLLEDAWYSTDTHPTPRYDPLLCNIVLTRFSRFAFISMESLKDWFYIDEAKVEEVRQLGVAKISVYEVEEEYLHIGEQQVIVYADHMTLVEELEL